MFLGTWHTCKAISSQSPVSQIKQKIALGVFQIWSFYGVHGVHVG